MQRSLIAFLSGFLLVWSATGGDDESPQAIIKKAIKAHGGEANLAKTLRGKAIMVILDWFPGGGESSTTCVETFDIPHRYHRRIRQCTDGKESTMEYAVTADGGWMLRNDEEMNIGKPDKPSVETAWQAKLAALYWLLGREDQVRSCWPRKGWRQGCCRRGDHERVWACHELLRREVRLAAQV